MSVMCFSDMALSSLPDTLFTSRTTNFGGMVIPQELSKQQFLLGRPKGKKANQIKAVCNHWRQTLLKHAIYSKFFSLNVALDAALEG